MDHRPMSSRRTDALFRPFKIRSLSLENRIVMAPMTRCAAPEGIPNEANAEYYRRRAAGGVGLILSEGTVIDRPSSRNHPDIPFFHGDTALAGWKGVIDAVHSAGGRMGPQLWHTGAVNMDVDWEPVAPVESPSGLEMAGHPRGRAMSEEAIADTVAAFAQAAADAKRLGFDTLELHAAHGYLIDEFFWDQTNQRTDRYGGATIGERARFAAEVVAAVRTAVGPEFALILRISQWKMQDYEARMVDSPLQMESWLQPMVDAGIDVLHCSQRRFWQPEFPELDGEHGLNFAGWAKKVTGAATISVGSVGLSGEFTAAFVGESSTGVGIDNLLDRMERDEFDLIAVGRALISDAEWVRKLESNDLSATSGFNPASLGELV